MLEAGPGDEKKRPEGSQDHRQEQRFADLLKVITDFSTTSTDTRRRLLALEQEVEKLKNAS